MVDFFEDIPSEYKTHLPREMVTRQEIFGAVGEKAGEVMAEPFVMVGEGIKDSLRRIYRVAAQPLAGEPVPIKPFKEAPIEFLGSLAARVVALPIVMVKEAIEGGEKAFREAHLLRGGPRGELGEWTEEQQAIEGEALNLTIGAMVGGAPGAGTGVANIGRKDALRMLAKEFRGMKKAPRGYGEGMVELAKTAGEATPMGTGYRTVTKGMRDIPQSVLDVVKEVGLAPEYRYDIAGRFMPKRTRVEFQIAKPLSKETIPHEFLHGVQISKMGKRARGVPSAVLEAHAYEFEGIFMKAVGELPAGKRITGETFNRLYKEALGSMTKKYGTDFSKYKMQEIVSKAHMERKWKKFEHPELGELQSGVPKFVAQLHKDVPKSLHKFATDEKSVWQLSNFSDMTLAVKNIAPVERTRLYRPAVRLEDGTILWHPKARIHADAITMQPKVKKAQRFDYDAVKGSGGIGPDGHYYESSMMGDALTDIAARGIEDISGSWGAGVWERQAGRRGELQSKVPSKIGEMIELPGGKARYDGTWEAFGTHPERYQYTFYEGVAKGDTFVSSTQKMADIAAAGMRKIKMRGGGD